ncbi:MAG: hypothetical protein K9M75_05560 [Phycisphaerae bacterium]|nr:hypothetical protein [Phycisphaerae bacterium]
MINSAIRRVVGLSEIFSFAGTWLTRRGKRFTSLATIIALGAALADILGDNLFGYQIPFSKFDMATAPVLAASVTFGLGGSMRYAAKLLSGADRAAAEANSICEVREIKQTPQATRKQAQDLWDRVGQYESLLANGGAESRKQEVEYLSKCRTKLTSAIIGLPDECLARYGVDLLNRQEGVDKLVRHIEVANPLSSGIESSKEGFVESVVYAFNEAMPQMEQKIRIGFDLSQIETYRNWEIFESKLSKEYVSNRFLRSAVRKANLPLIPALKCILKGFGNDVLRNLTRNKLYMMAGKGMNGINSKLYKHAFDAQPFIWMTDQLKRQIAETYGLDVLNIILADRDNIRTQIFWDSARLKSHVYNCFEADYLRALRLRLGFDVEYAAGLLRQKPKDDIAEMSDLVGKKIFSDKILSQYQNHARISLEGAARFVSGLDDFAVRAVRIAYYTGRGEKSKLNFDHGDAALISQLSVEIVQTRIHEYLAREQVRTHCDLIEKLGANDYDMEDLPVSSVCKIDNSSQRINHT